MRILQLIHSYPPIYSGAEDVAFKLAKNWSYLGNDVCTVTCNIKGVPSFENSEQGKTIRIGKGLKYARAFRLFDFISFFGSSQ